MAKKKYTNPATGNVEDLQYDSKGNPITPTSTPLVTGDTTGTGMAPLYGWAGKQGFNPSALAANIYTQPFDLLPNVFKGINTGAPGYQNLRDIGADPVELYNIMMGSGGPMSSETGVSDFTNWLRNMYTSYGSRGGNAFSAGKLLGNILSQTKGKDTALSQILQGAGSGDQAGTLYKLIRDATAVGMNPLAAVGYNAAMQRASDAYGNAQLSAPASGGTNNPNDMLITEWIRKNFPTLVPR